MPVPVLHCQYATAVGHRVNSKGIPSSTWRFSGACQKDLCVHAGRSGTWFWMRPGCLLTLRNGGVSDAKKGEAEQTRLVPNSAEQFRAPHIADSTPKPLS